MGKQVPQWWRWYIKGEYHCEHCPYCWSDFNYDGDGNCGCYIRGDLYDTCRLVPPIRFLLGWARKKKASYWEEHQYDGIGEYYQQMTDQDEILGKLLLNMLENFDLFYQPQSNEWLDEAAKRQKSQPIPIDKQEFVRERVRSLRMEYEDKAHPVEHIAISKEWKILIKKTWNCFLDVFRPYFN